MFFILLVTVIYLRSLIVSLYCFLLALICIIVNHAVYTSMFGQIFTNDHLPAVLILALLSVNNVFVLNETWKQSVYVLEFSGRSRLRLAYTLRRAAINNLARTVAVSIIFNLAMLSDILIISTIGIYCSLASIVTFLVFNAMLPPMLIVFETHLADRGPCPKKTKPRILSRVYHDVSSSSNSRNYI